MESGWVMVDNQDLKNLIIALKAVCGSGLGLDKSELDNLDVSSSGEDNSLVEILEVLMKGTKERMRRKEIESSYTITFVKNKGLWQTRVNKKQVWGKTKDRVIDKVIKRLDNPECTLKTIFEPYLKIRKKEVLDTSWQKDVRNYETFIEGSKLAKIPLEKIDVDDDNEFLEHCLSVKPDMRKKYWQGIMITLNSMFQYAINKKYITDNPFRNFKPKNDLFAPALEHPEEELYFTQKELDEVSDHAMKDAMESKSAIPLAILLLFSLGLRIGELGAIKWKDLEVVNGEKQLYIHREVKATIDENGKARGYEVVSHAKTKQSSRKIPLSEDCCRLFHTIQKMNEKNGLPTGADDYVFLRKQGGEIKSCSNRCFSCRLKKYTKKANMLMDKSSHDARRTVITGLHYDGMELRLIQRIAGHKKLTQTFDYIKDRDEAESMAKHLGNIAPTCELLEVDW